MCSCVSYLSYLCIFLLQFIHFAVVTPVLLHLLPLYFLPFSVSSPHFCTTTVCSLYHVIPLPTLRIPTQPTPAPSPPLCPLQLQPLCYKRVEENLRVKFFNRLYNFYKPKNKVFSAIPYSPANSRKYSRVGCQLVQFLAKDEEVGRSGGFGCMHKLEVEVGIDQNNLYWHLGTPMYVLTTILRTALLRMYVQYVHSQYLDVLYNHACI